MQTKANKELRAVLKAAKPKGKPHYQRSAPEKRTWNGVTYDSRVEMEFHQAFPGAFRCLKGADTFNISPHGKYTPDFYFARETGTQYVEVKGTRYTPARREPKPLWSDRAKAKFLEAQSRWPGEFVLVIKHKGQWIDGQTGEVLGNGGVK